MSVQERTPATISASPDTPRDESPAPLAARSICVTLGGRQVLDHVDITVQAGTIHTLLGPNGAGKTTLVRTLLGLQATTAGRVERRGGIGYVPQRTDMDWDFPVTAADVVLLGLVRGISRWRGPSADHYRAVARALKTVELEDLKNRPVGEMSGGQRQRVLIARALAQQPRALVLDEPFTGLDMPSQELLSRLFERLAAQGVAVLMSTHDLTHALDIAHRVTLLNRTVVADGPPEALREADIWMRTFDVSPASPLLRMVRAAA